MPVPDMGPLPKIHQRHIPVELAKRELEGFLLDWESKHNLTRAESLFLLSDAMSSKLWLAVKKERK